MSDRCGTNVAFVLRAHAAQHHQRIGEGAEEGAERDLVAAVAGEVAQQPRPHLAGRQRQRRDGDREHRAGDADGRRRDRAEQRARAGAAAVVEPAALKQAAGRTPLRSISMSRWRPAMPAITMRPGDDPELLAQEAPGPCRAPS